MLCAKKGPLCLFPELQQIVINFDIIYPPPLLSVDIR